MGSLWIKTAVWYWTFVLAYLSLGAHGSNCPRVGGPYSDHLVQLESDQHMSLESPNYPNNYINHADCVWYIHSPFPNGSVIINVLGLDTENFYDHVSIGYGRIFSFDKVTPIGGNASIVSGIAVEMSGIQAPEKLIFKGEVVVWVRFVSDRGYVKRGFLLDLQWTDMNEYCSSSHFECESTFYSVCLSSHLECNGYPNCLNEMDEQSCEFCGKREIHLSQSIRNVTIATPKYPDEYPNMLRCLWHVTTDISNSVIEIAFLDFQTELYFDNVTIGIGTSLNDNLLLEFGGEYPPKSVVIPDEESVWIQFVSEGWSTYRGFVMRLSTKTKTVSDSICHPGEFTCESGFGCLGNETVCDGTALCLDASDERCDVCKSDLKVLNMDTKVNLTTPLYPRTYPDYLDCHWFFTSTHDGYIVVVFLDFDTEFYYDWINIGAGSVVTENSTEFRFSGSTSPNKVSVAGSLMWIQFTSDRRYGEPGVLMEIGWSPNPVVCEEGEFSCISTLACLDPLLRCDGIPQCMDNTDETGCDLCGFSVITIDHDQVVNLTSPLYPARYPNSMDCTWVFTSIDSIIRIDFEFFRVERGWDFVSVGEGNDTSTGLAHFLHGTELEVPKSIIVQRQTMWVRFTSTTSWNEEGFFAYVKTIDANGTCDQGEFTCNLERALFCLQDESKCDGRAICPDQADEKNCGTCGARNIFIEYGDVKNLTSANYPRKYLPDLLCSYLVESLEGSKIIVDIIDFDLERNYDFLIIGDGSNPMDGDSVIASLTGVTKVQRIVSSGERIWMKFLSDRTGTRRGFDVTLLEWNTPDVCNSNDIDCGNGVCVTVDARCNGFDDCFNLAEERQCENIECPGSYKCDVSNDLSEALKCVAMDTVCDGNRDCPMGDDETECDIKRCPRHCQCQYDTPVTGGRDDTLVFQVLCHNSWTDATIDDIARTAHTLTLSGSQYHSLTPGMFKGLAGLNTLSLSENNISEIRTRAFDGLLNLTWLDLSKNNIAILEDHVFEELYMLETLFMKDIPLTRILADAFDGLKQLKTLVLVRNKADLERLMIADTAAEQLESLQILYVDDHHLCCHFRDLENCITLEPQPPLFMCGSLMQNSLLRVFMWILGVSALVGNLAVGVWRFQESSKSEIQALQSFLIGNLAISDFMMGVYMVLIAGADAYFGKEYFVYSGEWRSGVACRFAGFLSLLSSEASVFFITLISIDRFISLEFPFSGFRLRLKSARMVVAVIWSAAVVLSIVPVIFAGPDSDLYDLSDVCIGLPLITRPSSYQILESDIGNSLSDTAFSLPVPNESKPAWFFSIAIFLGLNLCCFLVIFICYAKIFFTVKQSRKQANRSEKVDEEIKMALKMAAIVGTDFCCWVPVILMGILSQTGAAVIPLEMYTWSVVFILPINSSLNPYLYTFASLVSSRRESSRLSSKDKDNTKSSSIGSNSMTNVIA